MWGAIAGAAASLLGGLSNANAQEEAAEAQLQNQADAGIRSAVQGSVVPTGAPQGVQTSGSQKDELAGNKILAGFKEAGIDALKSGVSGALGGGVNKIASRILGTDARGQGKATKDYLANAFPELNPWERAGAGGTMSGSADAGFKQQEKLQKNQLDMQEKLQANELKNQQLLKQMDNDTAKDIAGLQSSTSLQNVESQMFPQMMMLEQNLQHVQEQILKTRQDTNLSKAQENVQIKQLEKQAAEIRKLLHGNSVIGGMFLDSFNAGESAGSFIYNNRDAISHVADGVGGAVRNSEVRKAVNSMSKLRMHGNSRYDQMNSLGK